MVVRGKSHKGCRCPQSLWGPVSALLHMNIRRALLDQSKGPSKSAFLYLVMVHQMPQAAHETTRSCGHSLAK